MTSIAFPTVDPSLSGSPARDESQDHVPRHLPPFRRMSMPTPPALLNRQSLISLASFDSMSEERHGGAFGPKTSVGNLNSRERKDSKRPQRRPGGAARRKGSQPMADSSAQEEKAVKRRKVIIEFYETERAYVAGLDLVYSHFLTPIMASLDTPMPLLDRVELTAVFSNFVDIWNLHRSFLTLLTALLSPSLSTPSTSPPPLSPILLSHFPYVSLYTPFIMSFPNILASLSSLPATNPAFAAFIKEQEADERCGKLKLRDWLLTIVQRCPRYLLLLKDLIGCTDTEDTEYNNLLAAHALLSKITNSLNTSLHTHSQTLSLLSLQRSSPNLPFPLISPGRTFLKRGTLYKLDTSPTPKPREFLLFSDCLFWLASDAEWAARKSDNNLLRGVPSRPDIHRRRSRSENEVPPRRTNVSRPFQQVSPKKVRFDATPTMEKWWFEGKTDLVDLEVVVSLPFSNSNTDLGKTDVDHRFEILSPEYSFAVYATSSSARDEWVEAIRGAKASLLVSLNVMYPHSTLTSSAATTHLRRRLVAAAYDPEQDEEGSDSIDGEGEDGNVASAVAFAHGDHERRKNRQINNGVEKKPQRGMVDHFVPAIWVPDGKTDVCMRCGRLFSWRRRRHHCRLCGRCVCAGCSGRTFFIYDPDTRKKTTAHNHKSKSKDNKSKSARACNTCYDTVFPIVPSSPIVDQFASSLSQSIPGSTLASFPSWKTARASELSSPAVASALMSMSLDDDNDPFLSSSPSSVIPVNNAEDMLSSSSNMNTGVMKRRRRSWRPLSHPSIPPEFQVQIPEDAAVSSSVDSIDDFSTRVKTAGSETEQYQDHDQDTMGIECSTETLPLTPKSHTRSIPSSPARSRNFHLDEPGESRPQNRKRFSLPAIAIQSHQVTTKPSVMGSGSSKRFSLVLSDSASAAKSSQSHSVEGGSASQGQGQAQPLSLRHGIAAAKLNALLQRAVI